MLANGYAALVASLLNVQKMSTVWMSTNYFVITAQNQLSTAQNNELQAILNYRKSLVDFDRLQQTTLTSQNITLVGH